MRRLLTPLILVVAVVLAGAGYWLLRVHQRAGAATVQADVTRANPGAAAVRCVETRSNGAAWACGVAFRAESVCVTAKVSLFGSVSESPGRDRCAGEPELAGLPPAPTDAGVAADVARLSGAPAGGLGCVHVPGTERRWACAQRGAIADSCRIVRVAAWRPWKLLAGRARCLKLPALRRRLG